MRILKVIQNTLLGISLFILVFVSLWSAFGVESMALQGILYQISFVAVFLVMLIRPLADIFFNQKWLRKLVFLRKGFGVLSAAIVVAFVIGDIIAPDSQYIMSMFTKEYWSLENYVVFAHIGDITGFILLITSNNLSMMLLKKNWKRIQKLAYVYFYSGGIYEAYALNSKFAMIAMVVITLVTIIAFILNHRRKKQQDSF